MCLQLSQQEIGFVPIALFDYLDLDAAGETGQDIGRDNAIKK